MTTRRDFMRQLGVMGAAATMPHLLSGMTAEKSTQTNDDPMIWAMLIHLSYNMWQDHTPDQYKLATYLPNFSDEEMGAWATCYHPDLTCEKKAWNQIIERLAESGVNMVVIDLGDGVLYDSHPEISVKGAWTKAEVRDALTRMRQLGIEPIPKLNFSTGHKAWLGRYQFMVSSEPYYQVCKELIKEVVELFDQPRFFHLGMDEETCSHQADHLYTVVRKKELWWKDLYYFVDQVEKENVRSWIWSDACWRDPTSFFKNMPKTVLQSNWVYEESGLMFNDQHQPNDALAQGFIDLEEKGYDQIPTGSIWLNGHWNNHENFKRLVMHNQAIISPQHLKGFMQTVWLPTLDPCLPTFIKAADLVKEAKGTYYPNG